MVVNISQFPAICPETITELVRFQFLRCTNYVAEPESNSTKGKKCQKLHYAGPQHKGVFESLFCNMGSAISQPLRFVNFDVQAASKVNFGSHACAQSMLNGTDLSGAESAILNQESGDSNRAIWIGCDLDWRFWIEFPRFYFTAIPLAFVLHAVEILAIPGLRFWEQFGIRNSMPLEDCSRYWGCKATARNGEYVVKRDQCEHPFVWCFGFGELCKGEKRKSQLVRCTLPTRVPSVFLVCIYIYIYAVELLSGPSLALLEVIIWSKFVFF